MEILPSANMPKLTGLTKIILLILPIFINAIRKDMKEPPLSYSKTKQCATCFKCLNNFNLI